MTGYLTLYRQCFKPYQACLFCVLLIFLATGCGGENSEPGTSDNIASTSIDTGSASFAVQWHTADPTDRAAAVVRQAIENCENAGVASITCKVYDQSQKQIARGGPWDCSDHEGTIERIPAGSNRILAVFGWSDPRGGGHVIYRGQVAGITITPGQITNAGTIDARPFTPQLLSPGNGDSVAVNSGLTWNSVTNASRYHVLVSTDSTFATRTIDELTNDANPTYMPVGLTPATIYYWRVTALDAYGNEGAPPTAWSFTTTETTNELPTATISAPANNSSFTQGDTVNLSGSGQDPEDGTLTGGSLVWTSSRDGQIGTGASFGTQSLSVGTHTITLTVTDSDNASDTDSINITISSTPNQPPVATISAPANNSSFTQGDTVNFSGSGQDSEDGSLSGGSLVWNSSRDGRIGTGTSFGTSSLSVGTHTITLTVTDSDGAADTDSIRITVSAPPNQPPTANITAPSDGSTFTQGDLVTFRGTGQDPEDGTLSGGSLVWTSSISGRLGTGTSFQTQSLSLGNHTITLTVTDSDGAADTDSIRITISAPPNQPPTANITAPSDGSSFTQGDLVSFRGTGQDPEDGSLSGSALVWSSSINGRIGTGETFQTQSLSVGSHTITLTITDSDGAADTDSIRITVSAPPNQPPTANITAPSDGSSFTQGDLVTFRGTGQDPEDGSLSGSALVWTSSINGRIGTGTSFETESLSAGNHTITLTVTDSDGATDTDSIRITVIAPNQPPTANITSPSDGSTFSQGDLVTFRGTGQDPEDGSLSGSALVWTSSINGRIGTGTSFETESLSAGNHTITLTVTDSDGATDTDSIRIVITNVIDVNIDYDFDYITGSPTGFTWGETRAVGLSQEPYETIIEPPYGDYYTPHYGYFILGNSRDNRISFILVQYRELNAFFLLVDRNNNEDLTDDGDPYNNEGTGLFAATIDLNVSVVLSGGIAISRPYRMWFWIDSQMNPRFYARCYYRGQLVIGGRSYTAIAFEAQDHDVLYQESGLYIDLNADGSMDEQTENFMDGEQFTVNGANYVLQLNYP